MLVVDDGEETVGDDGKAEGEAGRPQLHMGAWRAGLRHRSGWTPWRWTPAVLLSFSQLSSSSHAMSSSAGLSRRRVPASASSAGDDDADNAWGFNGTASANGGAASRPDPPHSPALHAGSAFEGGSKIAYDPRDLEREDEDARLGGKPPRLTIMEEVLLLGLKDKQVSIPTLHRFSHTSPSPVYSQPSSSCKMLF